MEINDIMVPAFVTGIIAKLSCDECGAIGNWWIRAAGAKLDSDNRACFFTTLWCGACETKREIVFVDRAFYREEWWYDIAAWFGDAARPDQAGAILSRLAVLSDFTLPFRKGRKVHQLRILGGYVGEVGPVVLLYRREAVNPHRTYGVARLEPNGRLRFLAGSDREALGVSKWPWFCGQPDDTDFGNKGLFWRKLSPARIAEIVRDKVFEEWTIHDRKSVVPKTRKSAAKRK